MVANDGSEIGCAAIRPCWSKMILFYLSCPWQECQPIVGQLLWERTVLYQAWATVESFWWTCVHFAKYCSLLVWSSLASDGMAALSQAVAQKWCRNDWENEIKLLCLAYDLHHFSPENSVVFCVLVGEGIQSLDICPRVGRGELPQSSSGDILPSVFISSNLKVNITTQLEHEITMTS